MGAAVTYQYEDGSDIDTTVVLDPTVTKEKSKEVDKWIELNLDGKLKHKTSSFAIIERDNYQITMIELYPCNSREELCRKEGEYIRNNDCINKVMAGRNKKEYYIDKKTLFKESYERRKDIILKKNECEVCGGSFSLGNKKTHEKTKKHQKHIQNATV